MTHWTIADLETLRESWHQMIHDRDIRIMEQLGPDVYSHVLGRAR